MSDQCELNNCLLNADIECSCVGKICLCIDHFASHQQTCKKPYISFENKILAQVQDVSEAEEILNQLKVQVGERCDKIIAIIEGLRNGTILSIDQQKAIIKDIPFGKKWDPTIVNYVKKFQIPKFDEYAFTDRISGLFKLEIRGQVTASLDSMSVIDKRNFLSNFGIAIPGNTTKLRFSQDRAVVFLCNCY